MLVRLAITFYSKWHFLTVGVNRNRGPKMVTTVPCPCQACQRFPRGKGLLSIFPCTDTMVQEISCLHWRSFVSGFSAQQSIGYSRAEVCHSHILPPWFLPLYHLPQLWKTSLSTQNLTTPWNSALYQGCSPGISLMVLGPALTSNDLTFYSMFIAPHGGAQRQCWENVDLDP